MVCPDDVSARGMGMVKVMRVDWFWGLCTQTETLHPP